MLMSFTPGVVAGQSNEDYHAGPGLSRSTLWTAYTKTPAHTRLIEEPEADSTALAKGSALDIAILDPLNFDLRVMRGPADRRGNKWIEAQAEATNTRRILLTEGVFKQVETMREIAVNHPVIGPIVSRQEGLRGASAYAVDPATGVLVKCRPDLWIKPASLMIDLKTSRDASLRGFSRSIAEYGYHVQEEWYRWVWGLASEPVEAFLFFVVESTDPYQIAVYEIDELAREQARKVISDMMPIMAACIETGYYPGYPHDVQSIGLPAWMMKDA